MRRQFVLLACLVLCPLGLRAQEGLPDITPQAQRPDSSALIPGALLAEAQAQARTDTASRAPRVPPADLIEVDQEPVVIAKKEPVYPEIALKEKREGRVWVKIWVDKSGVPREVVVLKSSDTVFNKSATDAAWQFKFTPAYRKKAPVDVWVAVPFKFVVADDADKGADDSTKSTRKELTSAVQRFRESIKTVMDGSELEKLKTCVDPSAYLIDGSVFESLYEAAQRRDKAKVFATEKNRKPSLSAIVINDEKTSAFEVLKTEDEGGGDPRFHTVVFQKSKGGDWMIRHWHTSK
jgi:TonB family protein